MQKRSFALLAERLPRATLTYIFHKRLFLFY